MSSTFKDIVSQNAFYNVAYPMIVLPCVLILARIGVQVWKQKGMHAQDYLIYFAFACFLAMAISYITLIPTIYAINKVRLRIAKPWPNFAADRIHYLRMMYVTNNLFWLSLWSVKLSLLFLYKRLLQGLPKIYIKLWWAVFAFCILSLFGCMISYITSCENFGAMMSRGECVGARSVRGQLASLYMSYSVDVISDIMIMALPVKLVWNLQMRRGLKMAVIALFASGFVIIAFATLRVVQIGVQTGNDTSPSPTWLALWTIIECSIAVCIGCGPALATLYHTVCGTTRTRPTTDPHGYIRQGESRSAGSRRLQEIELTGVASTRTHIEALGRDDSWDKDASSSQEELTAGSKHIIVKTTTEMDTIDRMQSTEKKF